MATLLSVPWHDIVFQNVLPLLRLEDLFYLRAVSKPFKTLVDSHLALCKQLNLVNKHMDKHGFKVLYKNCKSVRHLNIARCYWISDKDLARFLARNRCIVDVTFNYCQRVDVRAMHALILSCRNLSSLRMVGCDWLTTGMLDTLTYHQTCLEVVDFSRCTQLSQRCVLRFVVKFSRLRNLSLAFVPAVSDETVVCIAHHCTELEYLNIDGCPVTIQAINLLIQNCRKLESIKLTGTTLVRENFAKPFQV